MDHRYILEPLLKRKLDKHRARVMSCPCGKSNKDGKFSPYKDYDDRGYCHGCGLWFGVAANKCCNCRKEQSYSKYVDTENQNSYLSEITGKCLFCNYHYSPKEYFEAGRKFKTKPENNKVEKGITKKSETEISLAIAFESRCGSEIPVPIFKQSLKNHEENYFIKYLLKLFGLQRTRNLIETYFIGTSKLWQGSTVFWQIGFDGRVRTGKIMLYNECTGKRIKEPQNCIAWVHKALKMREFELQQCFFGEHLLKSDFSKPVAIVESEKTAIIASVYMPELIWIAAGSKNGLNLEKCKVLTGRNVILYPDLNGFENWTAKSKRIEDFAEIRVSNILELKADVNEKELGLDIADFLIKFEHKFFLQEKCCNQPNVNTVLIHPDDILALLCEIHTGDDFHRLIIASVKTNSGRVYDLLFDEQGEFVRQGEHDKVVSKVASFFERQFIPAIYDGVACWVHINL